MSSHLRTDSNGGGPVWYERSSCDILMRGTDGDHDTSGGRERRGEGASDRGGATEGRRRQPDWVGRDQRSEPGRERVVT